MPRKKRITNEKQVRTNQEEQTQNNEQEIYKYLSKNEGWRANEKRQTTKNERARTN